MFYLLQIIDQLMWLFHNTIKAMRMRVLDQRPPCGMLQNLKPKVTVMNRRLGQETCAVNSLFT